MRESGTDATLMDAVARQFGKVAEGGYGGEDMAAVYRAFRP
jgi:3-hydroxyisobutyrate dehydrogenase-like beta-hydroxyacid dehydrogenase